MQKTRSPLATGSESSISAAVGNGSHRPRSGQLSAIPGAVHICPAGQSWAAVEQSAMSSISHTLGTTMRASYRRRPPQQKCIHACAAEFGSGRNLGAFAAADVGYAQEQGEGQRADQEADEAEGQEAAQQGEQDEGTVEAGSAPDQDGADDVVD